MSAARKLIEVALPLDAINQASAREKSIRHGHPSTLHLWWARRPLAAARAVIFASLVDDPDDRHANPAFVQACRELQYSGDGTDDKPGNVAKQGDTPRMRLFDFIEQLVKWESTTDETIMAKARELIRIATNGAPPPLLDPFAGGGSIPLEAQRLGLEAHASDLNPVAVMINKAMIEIPPRFANMPPVNPQDRKSIFAARGESPSRPQKNRPQYKGAAGLAADVRYYGAWMRERARERIGHLYPKHNGETVIAWLWARTVISPNPAVNAPVPLVRSFVLSKKKGRECWARPVVEGKTVRFEVTEGLPPKDEDGTMIRRQGARCIISGEPISRSYMRSEASMGHLGTQLIAIVAEGEKGRTFHSPCEYHAYTAASAVPRWTPVGDLPEQALGFSVQLYGMDRFHKLFTPRQLSVLTTLSDLVKEAGELAERNARESGMVDDSVPLSEGGHSARAYGEAVSVYLAFAIDRATDFWSTLCRWVSVVEAVVSTFSRQALPMIWDYPETNPFSDRGANWMACVDRVVGSLDKFPSVRPGSVRQVDAGSLDETARMVSTDPPYYSNIGYADISDYFYVWMRSCLRDIYPAVLSTVLTPKAEELIASRFRRGSNEAAQEFFETGMLDTFANIRRFSRPDYPLSVYYAYKQHDTGSLVKGKKGKVSSTGWETMLTSLIKAGFTITGTWPVRTEGRTRLRAHGSNVIASSIIIVCRPRPADAPILSRRRFLDALRHELPAAIAQMRTGKILPVDLAQASIGPGMAIYSRYSQVLEANGQPLTVREALELINEVLAETLYNFVGEVDEYTRFAFDWFRSHQFEPGASGDAEVMATAKNTSLAGLQRAGVMKIGGGKASLIHWSDYDSGAYDPQLDERPTVWEAAHHLIERLNSHGEVEAAKLLNRMSADLAGAAQDLAFSLYDICDRLGWARHARDYNGLIASWQGSDGIASEAARLRREPEQADLM